MRRPALLDFVPRTKKKRFHFGLRSLLLFTSCVGPTVLLLSALPMEFYILPGGAISLMASMMFVAWIASYARPARMGACFSVATVVSAILVASVIISAALWGIKSAALPFTAIASVIATLTSGLAFGLSWSRYAA
jgi:hypothetical protein